MIGLRLGLLNDMGYDMFREFWLEIAHKFKLPIRTAPEGPDTEPAVN
jgi:hypothetical protein